MVNSAPRKQSYGSFKVNHFSPAVNENWPTGININISFEDALKLHLGLGQLLGHLNGYNRSTKEGKMTGVNLCVFTDLGSITINEGKIKEPL